MVAKNGEDTDLNLYNISYETGKWGLAAKFSGSKSYGQIDDSKYFDFPRDYDFANIYVDKNTTITISSN